QTERKKSRLHFAIRTTLGIALSDTRHVKKQINPAATAHLLRGAFYVLLLIAVSAIPFALAQRKSGANIKIAPWVIKHTASGQQAEFFVVLTEQADLSGAAALGSKAEKGRYVHDALLNKRHATQGPILQWLRERGIEHRSFYIVNAILVKG